MASPSAGFARTDDGHEFPYLDAGGERRLLARLPTPAGHPMLGLPGWASTGLPSLKLSEVKPFKRHWDVVPILDQNGRGACLPHAWTAATMVARAVSGAPYVPLSPWFLYSLTNGGRDAGSNAGDACKALTEVGVCPASDVPYGTIRPKGYSAAARQSAARFKLRDAVQIKGFEEAVTAAYFGWCVCFDLHAGAGFDVDSDGVCRYLAWGGNNHEVLAGEEYALVNGKPYIGGRNSWGTAWGNKGRCLWQPKHLDNSDETYAVRFILDDPEDAEMPPALTA